MIKYLCINICQLIRYRFFLHKLWHFLWTLSSSLCNYSCHHFLFISIEFWPFQMSTKSALISTYILQGPSSNTTYSFFCNTVFLRKLFFFEFENCRKFKLLPKFLIFYLIKGFFAAKTIQRKKLIKGGNYTGKY